MSDENLPIIARNIELPVSDQYWLQLGSGRELSMSEGPMGLGVAVPALVHAYVDSTIPNTWGRLLTSRQEIVAAWRRQADDSWFPRWYATDQVLRLMHAAFNSAAAVAMIEMFMDGDFYRAAVEELG